MKIEVKNLIDTIMTCIGREERLAMAKDEIERSLKDKLWEYVKPYVDVKEENLLDATTLITMTLNFDEEVKQYAVKDTHGMMMQPYRTLTVKPTINTNLA